MANSFFQLNYDHLLSIAKKFKDEGEDIAQLHSTTRQRVRDLHKEWIGDAADKFFDEMETELLPAVQRLSQALFLSQDMTSEIMKIIQDADEETVGYFRNQLSGDDFGASMFGSALNGLQGGSPGADDFGAGKFGEALGSPIGGGGSSSPDDFGAGKFGEALDNSDSASGNGGSDTSGENSSSQSSERESKKSEKEQQTETESTPTGGGGGGSSSSSSQGLKGDLKNMGIGLSDQAPQTASAGSDSVRMADHVYSGNDSPKPEGSEPKPDSSKPGVGTESGDIGQTSSGGGAAAGVAGAAAAGGAAKVLKKKKKDG
jgi:WXG100 family type VII secretion target